MPIHHQLLIIEDHPFVAHSTKELINRSAPDMQVTVCGNAAEAIQAMDDPRRVWHRILLDLDVPGAYGLSLALEIRRRELHHLTCVISALDRRDDFVAGIRELGFIGYIVKATPMTEFSAALEAVFRGEPSFPAKSAPRSDALRLTRRQAEVLNLVKLGYSSKEIAESLSLSSGTVNNHLDTVMSILNVASRSHAVAKAIELGLIGLATGPSEPTEKTKAAPR